MITRDPNAIIRVAQYDNLAAWLSSGRNSDGGTAVSPVLLDFVEMCSLNTGDLEKLLKVGTRSCRNDGEVTGA